MFLGYIHYFRALAIFFIVAGHTIDAFSWQSSPTLESILRIVLSNGSVLFVFIAGYLFQHLIPRFSQQQYFVNKFKNVVVPYLLISIPAIVISVMFIQRELVWQAFYEDPVWLQVVNFYLTGLHLTPLWFIPMICLFYLCAPALIALDKNEWGYCTLPLLLILTCIVGRDLVLQNFTHFFSVYLLGMFCSHYKSRVNTLLESTLFLSVLFSFSVGLSWYEFLYVERYEAPHINTIQKLCMALFFIGILYRYNEKLTAPYISVIANASFGVFFIHSYVISGGKMLTEKYFGVLPDGNALYTLALSLVLLLFCVTIIQGIQKVAGKRSRYLVGS